MDEAELERRFFEKGRTLLGKSAGAILANLLRSQGGQATKALQVIEMAATKSNPREYIARIIKNLLPRQSDMFACRAKHIGDQQAKKQIEERERLTQPHTEEDKARVAATLARFRREIAGAQVSEDARMIAAERWGAYADRLARQVQDDFDREFGT